MVGGVATALGRLRTTAVERSKRGLSVTAIWRSTFGLVSGRDMQDPECRLVGVVPLQISMKMEEGHVVVWIGAPLKAHMLKVSASGTAGMQWKL